jgi:hypothetical protein
VSDDILSLIPVDPSFAPERALGERAAERLHQLLPDGEMWKASFYEVPTFIDPGQNLQTVICPRCARRLTLDSEDVQEWWYEAIDVDDETDMASMEMDMPCCAAKVPFVELKFDWPAGCARFELSIWNPNIVADLDDDAVAELQAIVGCKLMQVRAHL